MKIFMTSKFFSPLSPLCFWLLWEIPWHQKDEKTKRRILCYILPTLKFSEQPPTEKKNGREEILKKMEPSAM
jgi:hypothetical protein